MNHRNKCRTASTRGWLRQRAVATLSLVVTLAACGVEVIESSTESGSNYGLSDEVSMPAAPMWSASEFDGAQRCGECHPRHFKEWSTSMHAYATKDPVWRALTQRLQTEAQGESDRYCGQCHSPIGTRAGEFDPGYAAENWSQITHEGVTCETCHRMTSLVRTHGAGFSMKPKSPIIGPISQPASSPYHDSAHVAYVSESRLCGSCHDVLQPSGLVLEQSYAEWLSSPAARSGQTCQSCHMPTYAGHASAMPDSPWRNRLHSHAFVGASMPLSPDFIQDQNTYSSVKSQVQAMLSASASVELIVPDTAAHNSLLKVQVVVCSHLRGHAFPTGSSFNRELWLELTVHDQFADEVYSRGKLDEMGNVPSLPDSAAHRFDAQLMDAAGHPTIFPWRAHFVRRNELGALECRSIPYMVPTPLLGESLQINTRLRFREFRPDMLRALGLDQLLPHLHVMEVGADSTEVLLLD